MNVALLIPLLPLVAILAVWVGALFDPRLQNVLYKLHLLRVGLTHMMFSTDKRWNKKKQPDSGELTEVEGEKTLIFVRHAESAWNLVFNKGFGADFPGRLGDALYKEGSLANTLDSVFMDAPLSKLGTDQAEELQRFVETGESSVSEILRGEGDSIIVSSNLRRALSTGTIGFWDRLKRTQEKIYILSSLQEVTFNVDGVSLAKAGTAPQLSDTELAALYGRADAARFDPDIYYDSTYNAGNKAVFTTGVERMQQFCEWCFEQDEQNIIAAGHSLYNKFFFQTFLPKASKHQAKSDKMANCSVVELKLKKGKAGGKTWYAIDEDSIVPHYLGFETKKNKKKKTQ